MNAVSMVAWRTKTSFVAFGFVRRPSSTLALVWSSLACSLYPREQFSHDTRTFVVLPWVREAGSWLSWATLGDRFEHIVIGCMVAHLQAIDDNVARNRESN
jgi:hypothetical protein